MSNFYDKTKKYLEGTSTGTATYDTSTFAGKTMKYLEGGTSPTLPTWGPTASTSLPTSSQIPASPSAFERYSQDERNWLLGVDTTKGKNDISALESDLQLFEELTNFRNSYRDYLDNGGEQVRDMDTQSKLAQYDQLARKYGSVDNLNQQLAELRKVVGQAERLQTEAQMESVSSLSDFASKSAYTSTALDTAWQKMWSEGGAGYGDVTYEFINNTDGVREKVRNTGSKEKWRLLEKMTPEEVAVYNYHYATNGKEAAEKYIDSIMESLSARRASDIYAPMEGKTGRELLFGVGAGLDQFGTGMQNLVWGGGKDYIPTNAMQYASGMVREDLADVGFNLPDWMGGASIGQAAYDTITTSANMAPSILTSLAIGMVSKTAGGYVGSTLLGASAGGNAYAEMLNAGYSKEQARTYGALVGTSEAVMEKVLGGISAYGGGVLSDVVVKNLDSLDNALARFLRSGAGQVLMNAGSEAVEEFTQSVLEPYIWEAVTGEQTSVDWEEAAYSAMLGFVTGGMFEAGAQTYNAVNEAVVGRSVLKTEDGLANINAAADSVSSTATPTVQREIARAQEKAARGRARAAGQLYNTVSAEVTKADTADIVSALNAQGIKGDAATQIADLIVNKLGSNLNARGEKLFNEAMRDKRVQTVVSDLIDNKMSTVSQRNQKLAAATGKEASTIDVAKVKEQHTKEFIEKNLEYQVSDDGRTIDTKTGKAVEVVDIKEISKDGAVKVQLEDGSVVDAADLSFASNELAMAYSALKGRQMSAANANALVKLSEGVGVQEFAKQFELGYERGYANLSKPEGKVAEAAYKAGMDQRADESNKEPKKTRESGINRIGRDGSISVISADEDVSDKGFNKRQLPAVQTIQALEKLDLGTAFFVIESYKIKVNGKTHIVFTDENGQVKDAPNGMYYKDGRVYIDINAGRGATGKFVLQTAAHELAHHIQQWNPSKYKVLADFLATEYGKHGVDTYSAIKAKQQELSQIRGRSVSFSEAYHEWIADNLSVMFNDGNLYDKLVKLKHKDSALFNEIHKFIDELAKRVRKSFGMDGAETSEGKFVLSWDTRVIDRLQQIYAEALVESSERYAQAAYVENQAAEVQASTKNDGKYMEAAIRMNTGKGFVQAKVMEQAAKVRSKIAETMKRLEMDKRVALPEDVEGNTAIANSSYDVTEENTTICPRSLASEAFVDAVSEMLGRPLTVAEQLRISQDLQGRTLTPECLYCYVATDRKAYRAFLGSYVQQRDAVIKAYKDGNTDTSRDGSLYQQFLDGRKDTSNMWKRFNLWINTYKSGKPMVQASNLANISKLMGDINAEFGADLKAQIKDAMAYAQSASWAKKRISYVAYNGHILRWKQDRINKLNSHYGLRMYSFSDFSPAFILENMQMITDAAVRGLKVLGYTKEIDFVKIFAKTGMNINVSTFGFEAGGNVYENNIIGANWAEAQKLREQYPNVGVTFVATNDTLVEWALAQDWIDVVIPYHLVRTGAEVAAALNYKNYTSESSDVKDIGWKKGVDEKYIAPTVHNNDFDTYMEALKKNHLKPRFERFIDNPNYMKLVNETRQSAAESKPVQPIFDMDAATESLAKLEADGYYKPIGDTVERMYEIAADVAAEIEPRVDVQYSSRESIASAAKKLETMSDAEYLKYKSENPFVFIMDHTPKLVLESMADDDGNLPHSRKMIIRKDALYLAIRESGIQEGNYHGLGAETLENLPSILEKPDAILQTDGSNRRRLVLTHIESKNGQALVSVEFEAMKDIDGKNDFYNIVVTVFDLHKNYLKRLFQKRNAAIKYEKEDLAQVNPELHTWLRTFNAKSSNDKLTHLQEEVNTEDAQKSDRFTMTRTDRTYLDAVRRGDVEAAQKMVDEAAKAAGYSTKVYHGTQSFGFTKLNVKKSDDGISFFATDDLDVAGSYSGMIVAEGRNISEKKQKMPKKAVPKLRNKIKVIALEFLHEYTTTLGRYDSWNMDSVEYITNRDTGEIVTPGELIQYATMAIDTITAAHFNTVSGKAHGRRNVAPTIPAETQKKLADVVDQYSKKLSEVIAPYYDSGVYSLYANTDNHLVIEANGSNWNDIKSDSLPTRSEPWKTRDVAQYAKEHGYSGVTFKNLVDPANHTAAKPATIYAFLNPKTQLKSADPITYDNLGRVVPLSKRFNAEKNDIRYSDRLTEPTTASTDITEEMRQRGEKAIETATAQREARVAAEQKTHRAIRAALTNRDLIAQIEGKTELEKRKLKEYNDALVKSREFAATVTDLNRQIKEVEESNDPKKAETVKNLTFELNKAKANKKTMESKLSRMENKELEPLVARERVRIIEELRKEYGTIPAGENPVRDDSLPTSTDGENFVSRTARTVKGAGVIPDDFADLIDTEVAKGGLTYIRITNDEATQRAVEKITKNGWEQARADWSAAIKAGKASAEMSAMGALLLNNAANAGDKKAWLDILHDYQQMGTNAAQAVQAMRILKTLEPSDKLYMAEKSLDSLADSIKTKNKITINEALKEKYINAKTDAERDAIMGEIQQDIANQIPPTIKDKWTALRYLNMLGNLRTQARNIFGNTSMGLAVRLKDLVATGIEGLAYVASKGKFERTKALLPGKELRKAASADYDFVADIIATGGKFNDANNANSAFIRGVMEKRKIFTSKLFAGLEAYRKGTNWAMDKGDVLFSRAAYASALAGYLKAHGVTETDFSKINETMLEKARLYAVQEAQEATFHDINAVSEFVTRRYRGENKAGKALSLALEGIMPFRKTPANIVVRAWEYSPLGITNALVMSAKAFAKDSDVTGAQIVNAWSKALTGSGLFVAGLLLASSGHLIGGPDDDEAEDKFQQLNGEQNYALKIGNKYITIDWASPSAIPLFMGAQLYQLTQENGFQLRDLETALTSIADPLVEMSMLQGLNDTIDNIKYSDNKLMQLAINAIVGYFTQGVTNTMIGQIERSFEKSRSTTYVDKNKDLPDWLQRTLGKVSAKFPGLDYNQIPYINAWGEEEENPGILRSLVYNMLSPSYITEDKTDAVSTELQRLEVVNTTSRSVYPSAAGKKFTFTDKDGVVHKDYQLSAEEYVAMAKAKGQTQRDVVEKMIASKLYKNLPDLYKVKAIQAAYTYANEKAQIDVLNRDSFSSKWMGEISGNVATGILEHIYEENAKDMYTSGEISSGSAVGILVKYSELDDTAAAEKVAYWDFQEDYPEYKDLSQAAVTDYYEYAKPSRIPVSVYYDYCTEVTGLSKKADKMAVIDAMPISAAQKDALYFSHGWAESKLNEAPWH